MIPEDGKKIKQYYYIDRCGVELGAIEPRVTNETITGIVTYCGTHDIRYIEHRIGGKLTQTVNIADVSMIEWE